MRVRTLVSAATLAVVALTAGCGDDEPEVPTAEPPATSPAATEDGVTPAPTEDGATEGEALVGTVGEVDDPDAFTITLTDATGQPVESLPAGDYTIQVNDLSEIHNFHLTGPGVEESTEVPETGEATWEVTLEAGTYTFVCDPHPNMRGELTVT